MLRPLVVSFIVLCAPRLAEAGTLFTNPVIVVTPMTLDCGRVVTNTIATNTFLVENIGRGRLVGAATVAAPFKILAGGDYSLLANEVQVMTVTYQPSGAASDTQTVQFTGGGGAKATITGKPAIIPPKKPRRK
jgi:hypothetical protein